LAKYWAGSIKREAKKKHISLRTGRRWFSDIQPLSVLLPKNRTKVSMIHAKTIAAFAPPWCWCHLIPQFRPDSSVWHFDCLTCSLCNIQVLRLLTHTKIRPLGSPQFALCCVSSKGLPPARLHFLRTAPSRSEYEAQPRQTKIQQRPQDKFSRMILAISFDFPFRLPYRVSHNPCHDARRVLRCWLI